jgi:signal transduction histidine kinase
LRTPLTVIEGTADAILDGVYEPTPEVIRSMRDEARTLTKVVADLRTISLADAGQLRLELEDANPKELVARAAQAARASAQDKGVGVTVENAPDLPQCRVDPERIAQVLGNLLSNAIRHTPSGGTIVISARRSSGVPEVVFSVADSGEGIAAEDLPLVFDRFFRADRSRARRSGGSGLGLAISKQIVEQHGGRIWAESKPGSGATFSFAVPTSTESMRPEPERATSRSRA